MQESTSVPCPPLLTPFVLVLLPPLLQSSPTLQPPLKLSLLFVLFLSGCSASQVVGMSPDLIKSSEPPVVSLFVFHKVKRHFRMCWRAKSFSRGRIRNRPTPGRRLVGRWKYQTCSKPSGEASVEQAGTCLMHGPGWPLLHGQLFFLTHPEILQRCLGSHRTCWLSSQLLWIQPYLCPLNLVLVLPHQIQ